MAQAKSITTLYEPDGGRDPLWQSARRIALHTMATPHGMQTSEYLQKTYRDGDWGKAREILVSTWQTRHNLTVLLQWKSANPQSRFTAPDSFLDRCAVLFPSDENTAFVTMGSPESPARIWTWRADGKVEQLLAKGPGTISALSPDGLKATAQWLGGSWRVTLSGAHPAGPRRFTVATWDGQAKERGGLKAFAPEWIELDAL